MRGGTQVGPGEPAELGLLGAVDGRRRGAVADAPPGLDLAEHQQPGRLGDHVDLTRLAAPVAGHDAKPGGGQPGAGERFTAPPQFAAIGGMLGRHGPHPSRRQPRIGRRCQECGKTAPGARSVWWPATRGGGLESRGESGHARPVENTGALSARRDMFLDERGAGLRVTWHPERDLVVLSVWHDESCVGTFRMPVQDVPRLSGLLAAALGDWVDQSGGAVPLAWAGPAPGTGPTAGARSGAAAGVGPGAGAGPAAGPGGPGLSMQQRLRLSRPVLRLRGLQHRRRRPT